jgi:Flp pilus assembly protein TadB
MSAVNVLSSLLVAVGIFALVIGVAYRRPVDLKHIERLYGQGLPELTSMQKLQGRLDAARLEVSASEFVRLSLILAVLGGLGFYILAGVPLAALLGTFLGGAAYYLYVSRRAAKALSDYEDQLPSVVARLITGARKGGNFRAAAQHVAQYGPELCRDDWHYIAEQASFGVELDQIFGTIAGKRGSVLLDTIFELLVVQEHRQLSLTEMLPGIQKALTERVTMMKKARTRLGGPIKELSIVATIPFILVIILRLMSPTMTANLNTLIGQAGLVFGWGLTVTAYILAYRSFQNGLNEETSFGGTGLQSQARAPLRAATPPNGQPPAGSPLARPYRP